VTERRAFPQRHKVLVCRALLILASAAAATGLVTIAIAVTVPLELALFQGLLIGSTACVGLASAASLAGIHIGRTGKMASRPTTDVYRRPRPD
jgi:hypothetical protein